VNTVRTTMESAKSDTPRPKKSTSEKKIEANRRNALRSTGPTTDKGKTASSRNAIKHGLLAREVVITAGDGEENAKDFHVLLRQLWTNLQPIGTIEELLVERVAICWWRLARVVRAENGEIRRRLDTFDVDVHLSRSDRLSLIMYSLDLLRSGDLYNSINEADKKLSSRERRLAIQKLQTDLKKDEFGVTVLCQFWSRAKRELSETGRISKGVHRAISSTVGLSNYPLLLSTWLGTAADDGQEQNASPDGGTNDNLGFNKDIVMWLIDKELELLEILKEHAGTNARLETDVEARSLALPSADATEKLLRYEAHLERQLYRAMDQLERLQRRRKGESVPPPLNVSLGRR